MPKRPTEIFVREVDDKGEAKGPVIKLTPVVHKQMVRYCTGEVSIFDPEDLGTQLGLAL